MALRRACCTAGRTARRSTRGPSVPRTRRTKSRLRRKGSRRITPTTRSDDDYRTDVASDDDGELSRGSQESRRSYSSRDDGEDNYAVDFVAPRKRAKPNPSTRKKRDYIAASDDSGGNGTNGSNKKGKLKDPLYLSDSD